MINLNTILAEFACHCWNKNLNISGPGHGWAWLGTDDHGWAPGTDSGQLALEGRHWALKAPWD